MFIKDKLAKIFSRNQLTQEVSITPLKDAVIDTTEKIELSSSDQEMPKQLDLQFIQPNSPAKESSLAISLNEVITNPMNKKEKEEFSKYAKLDDYLRDAQGFADKIARREKLTKIGSVLEKIALGHMPFFFAEIFLPVLHVAELPVLVATGLLEGTTIALEHMADKKVLSEDGRFLKTEKGMFASLPPTKDKLVMCEILKTDHNKAVPMEVIDFGEKRAKSLTVGKESFYVNYEDNTMTEFSFKGGKLRDINNDLNIKGVKQKLLVTEKPKLESFMKKYPRLVSFLAAIADRPEGMMSSDEKNSLDTYLEGAQNFAEKVTRRNKLTKMANLLTKISFGHLIYDILEVIGLVSINVVELALLSGAVAVEGGAIVASHFADENMVSKDGKFLRTESGIFASIPPSKDRVIFCEVLKDNEGSKPIPVEVLDLEGKQADNFTVDKHSFYVNYTDGSKTEFTFRGTKVRDIANSN